MLFLFISFGKENKLFIECSLCQLKTRRKINYLYDKIRIVLDYVKEAVMVWKKESRIMQ